MPCSTLRRTSPVPAHPSPPHLPLEKVIQDHIPTVTGILQSLLTLLTTTPSLTTRSRHSLQVFERDLRKLCLHAQEGVRKMDFELRTIENTWESVDRERWEVCRGDYKIVMGLVEQVWEAGQERMEELRVCGVRMAAEGRTRRR